MIKKITTACLLSCLAGGVHGQSVCARADLQAAVDSYVEAQSSGDVSKLALADDVVFRENMSEVGKGDGLWNTALPIALSRSFLDSTRCKTFTEVIVTEGDHQYVVGTRLFVDGGKITRVDSLVTDEGDWLFNANAYLKYSSAEDWTAPAPEARISAAPTPTATTSRTQPAKSEFRQASSTL
jgi:hypothetical protein